MGLFDKLFPKKTQNVRNDGYFQLLNAYTPIFSSWNGQLYENDLVRSAIDARSRHIAKLKVEFRGSAQASLQTKLKKSPNSYQTWYQFLYRLNTILDMQNTVFIVPEYDSYMQRTGMMTFLPSRYELVDVDGDPWIRFYFQNGEKASEELANIAIITKHQYNNDLFGEQNTALNETMELINIQNQGIEEAAKNSSNYKFWARLNNFSLGEDLKKEREKFSKDNFASESGGGMLLFPNTYTDVHELTQRSYSVNADERKAIEENVYRYFGVNDAVMNNSAKGDELDAFFNGGIEPFAIQLSEVLTKWMFNQNEIAYGSEVLANANRLQYMTVTEKVNVIKEVGAIGGLKVDEIREIMNLSPLGGEIGEKIPIRGEYYFVGEERPAGRISEDMEGTEDTQDTEGDTKDDPKEEGKEISEVNEDDSKKDTSGQDS